MSKKKESSTNKTKTTAIALLCVAIGSVGISISLFLLLDNWDYHSSYYATPIDDISLTQQFHWNDNLYEFKFFINDSDYHPTLIISKDWKYVSKVLNLDKVKSWDDGTIRIIIKEVSAFGGWINNIAISDNGQYIAIGDNSFLRLAFVVRYDVYVK